jgi:hypothetical protein
VVDGSGRKKVEKISARDLTAALYIWYSVDVEITRRARPAEGRHNKMQIRIAEVTVDFDGREDKYYIMYPSPAPPDSPDWMILDTDGSPVCVDWTVDEVRDFAPDEFVDRLDAAARAAVAKDAGAPLSERRSVPGDSALAWAEDLGWPVAAEMAAS